MGIPVLIYGRSGTGKSRSLKNFGEDEITLINVEKKPLPFRKKFKYIINTDNYNTVCRALNETPSNIVIIDDAGYLLTNMFMREHSARGSGAATFDLYNDLGDRFWNLFETIKALPDNKIVYVIMHEEKDDQGEVKPKTIGKLLDEKVNIAGMFTIVLRCIEESGKHVFVTQAANGAVSKSPIGMFDDLTIDNDLAFVDQKIREYYEMGTVTVESKNKEETV